MMDGIQFYLCWYVIITQYMGPILVIILNIVIASSDKATNGQLQFNAS